MLLLKWWRDYWLFFEWELAVDFEGGISGFGGRINWNTIVV